MRDGGDGGGHGFGFRFGWEIVVWTRHVDDNSCGFGGVGGLLGGLGVAILFVFYGDAVEEELGDVGHGDGVFAGDFVVGELVEEIGEELVYLRRVGEVVGVG